MKFLKIWIAFLLLCAAPIWAADGIKTQQRENTVVTKHSIEIQGKTINYDAIAGTVPLKNQEGVTKASLFFTAYHRTDTENTTQRPITFCFNGGPGSSSAWLQMGVFGPARVSLQEIGKIQAPYHKIDNEYSILDMTDLVFIDPISTGYSRPSAGEAAKQFHGFDEDVAWVGEFIRYYTTYYERWESPKFIAGESYGTTRAAALANHLNDEYYMFINGILLISSILDFQTRDSGDRDSDISFITNFPSLTATAWYHKRLAPELQALDLQEILRKAESFALVEYALALLQGDWLSGQEKDKIAAKMASLTGLPSSFIVENNLRINGDRFLKILLRDQLRVAGRFDSRFTGIDTAPYSYFTGNDPSQDIIFAPITAIFNEYMGKNLQWKTEEEYKILTNVFPWNYGNGANNKYLNVAGTLREVMSRNPQCLVFAAIGYYDMATPYFAQEYTFKHLNLDRSIRDNLLLNYYEAGHMMYIDPSSLKKMRKDLEFYYQKAKDQEEGNKPPTLDANEYISR